MPRVTPKTNWVAGNVPLGPDLNRMEGNTQQAFDEIDEEIQNRIDDVNAEEARAIAAEAAEAAARASISTLNAVGSYAFLFVGGLVTLNPGDTITQSSPTPSLKYAGIKFQSLPDGGYIFPILINNSIYPTGTWRCMGFIEPDLNFGATLFVKIS